jgi:nicotinamidase-related amidase
MKQIQVTPGLMRCGAAALCLALTAAQEPAAPPGATPPARQGQERWMKLALRNVSYPATDPGSQDMNAHWQRRERSVEVPAEQTALILIDVWDIDGERQPNPPVGDRIVHTAIAPLLEAARAADLLVIHAAHRPVGWDGRNTGPRADYRAGDSMARNQLPAEVAKQPVDPNQWPPREFVYRVGEYGQFARNDSPAYLPYAYVKGIHPGALPVKRAREVIESDPDRVQRLLRENKILHLLYVGEWTNGCVVMRAVGIRRMSSLGYNTIILRDATWGPELADTWETMEVTRGAVLDIEILNGFSALASEVTTELQRLPPRAAERE